jgi:hypothetical protein
MLAAFRAWINNNPYSALLAMVLLLLMLTLLVAKELLLITLVPLYTAFSSRARAERQIAERKAEQRMFAEHLRQTKDKAAVNTAEAKKSAAGEVDKWLDR